MQVNLEWGNAEAVWFHLGQMIVILVNRVVRAGSVGWLSRMPPVSRRRPRSAWLAPPAFRDWLPHWVCYEIKMSQAPMPWATSGFGRRSKRRLTAVLLTTFSVLRKYPAWK